MVSGKLFVSKGLHGEWSLPFTTHYSYLKSGKRNSAGKYPALLVKGGE